MINYAIEPSVLMPLVPKGTELDHWQGKTLVSMVGFLFLDTRLLGWGIPFHRDFEEVNLRFYVRHKGPEGWRRGVVFVREIVPRLAIAWTARALYGEKYAALPMWHRLDEDPARLGRPTRAEFGWRFHGRGQSLSVEVEGDPYLLQDGTEEEFIAEHYWGYARQRGGGTVEYEVAHPRWRIQRTTSSRLDADVAALYGNAFVEALTAPPTSAFLAEGSAVKVFWGKRVDGTLGTSQENRR